MNYKFNVEGEMIHIPEGDWKVFIILDACRYDYFKKVYRKKFKSGKLRKAVSPFRWTMEYLTKTYRKKYDDIVYISGTPFVNSFTKVDSRLLSFDGKKHFHKVVDVWNFGWNEKKAWLHPREMNKAFLKAYKKNPDKRFIIHYMQPHNPYITEGGGSSIGVRSKEVHTQESYTRNIAAMIKNTLRIFLNDEMLFWLERKLDVPWGEWSKHHEVLGPDGIRRAYENDLLLVLDYVKEVVQKTRGKVIVSADHGDLLGECKYWGHGKRRLIRKEPKQLFEVPWFEIYGEKDKIRVSNKEKTKKEITKNKIKQRLRDLGYD